MANTSNISELTIILTTYNRPEKLRSILDYHLMMKKKYKIIVSDCSSQISLLGNKEIISKVNNFLNIEHLVFPKDYDNYEAFYYALEKVKTPYVVMSADDDFLITNGLEEAVKFLEKNLDYVASQGKQLFFQRKLNYILFGKLKMVENSIEENSVSERILNTIVRNDRYYAPKSVFSIIRTDFAKKIYDDALSLGLDYNNTEGLIMRLVLITGKIKFLPSLYIVRELGEYNTGYIAKIKYTKIINNKYNLKSFHELNINETSIYSDENLQKRNSYNESINRIRFLCVKYIIEFSNLDAVESSELFEKWIKFFKLRRNLYNSKILIRINVYFLTMFYNLYPFGNISKISSILKKNTYSN